MKLVLIAFLTLAAGSSFASTCNVSCSVSRTDIINQLPRHASGGAYADFQAYCSSIGGSLAGGPSYSGCDLFCVTHSQTVETLTGYGSDEFIARQEARKSCMAIRDDYGSGCGFRRALSTVGAMSCY